MCRLMLQLAKILGAALARLYLLPVYFLSGFVPRRPKLWVFGSWGGQRFADNSAALFIHCHEHLEDDTELVWISHRRSIVREVRARGYAAHWWWSPSGIACCARAGVHLFDCFGKDSNFWLSRGALLINLWSGVPLKSFERDIDNPTSRYYRLFHGPWHERVVLSMLMPWHVTRPDLIIATSPVTAAVTARAFDIPRDDVPTTGLPRNDRLLSPEPASELPAEVAALRRAGRRLVFYLPTFRDSGDKFIDFDWHRLDALLEEKSATLLIKLHPVDDTRLDIPARNVATLNRGIDIYGLLPHAAALISDYSSAIWDFLLLQRPVILFAPDIDTFVANSRSLVFEPEEIGLGPVCRNFDELEQRLRQLALDPAERNGPDEATTAVARRFHTHLDAGSSQRVLDAVRSRLAAGKPSPSGKLATLRYKLRYNSWPRLVINALKRVGITVLPYYLFRRPLAESSREPDDTTWHFRELTIDDVPALARLPMVHGNADTFRKRLLNGQRSFALTRDDEIFAFTWADLDACSYPGENFPLANDEVYLYDIYTVPAQRGNNLAPLLNAHYSKQLREEGIRTVVSVVDALNRPSLNYSRKIGATRVRRNLYLNIFGVLERSFVLRDYASQDPTPQRELP